MNLSSGLVTSLVGSLSQTSGHADGAGTVSSFRYPFGVALGSAGAIAIVVGVRLHVFLIRVCSFCNHS